MRVWPWSACCWNCGCVIKTDFLPGRGGQADDGNRPPSPAGASGRKGAGEHLRDHGATLTRAKHFGPTADLFGRNPDRFTRRADLFGRSPDRFTRRVDHFGRNPDRFTRNTDLFGRSPNLFTRRTDLSGRREDRFTRNVDLPGRHPAHRPHATVALWRTDFIRLSCAARNIEGHGRDDWRRQDKPPIFREGARSPLPCRSGSCPRCSCHLSPADRKASRARPAPTFLRLRRRASCRSRPHSPVH